MTNKWTVNGVEAPEGAEFYADGLFRKDGEFFLQHVESEGVEWKTSLMSKSFYMGYHDYQERPKQWIEVGERIEIIATNGNDGEHYNDYAFCLSEAINKLKQCADVAPDDKRKDALLEIVDEVEFIKSEGDK